MTVEFKKVGSNVKVMCLSKVFTDFGKVRIQRGEDFLTKAGSNPEGRENGGKNFQFVA